MQFSFLLHFLTVCNKNIKLDSNRSTNTLEKKVSPVYDEPVPIIEVTTTALLYSESVSVMSNKVNRLAS